MPVFDPTTGKSVLADVGGGPTALAPANTPAPGAAPLQDPVKIAALKAGAQGGQAGIDAFNQARAEVDQMQAQAIAHARDRARLIGGPEALGFEAAPVNQYERNRMGLATAQTAAQNLQSANRAAFDKYFGQLKGDMGAINEYIKNTLGGYEAKKRAQAAKTASAQFPMDEILGQTELDLGKAQESLGAKETELTGLQAEVERQKSRTFTAPIVAQMQANAKKLDDIAEYKRMHGTVPKSLLTKEADLVRRQTNLQGHLDKGRKTEDRKLAEAEQRLAVVQKEFDALKGATSDPTTYARRLAIQKYGISPAKAAGKLTPDKFIGSKQTALDTQKYGEQVVGLAQKLNIKGGAKRTAELLADQDVSEDIIEYQNQAIEGQKKLSEVKREVADFYLKGKKPRRDEYNVIIEMIAHLPWKSERS